jgi:lipoate-protein ligase A
MRVRRIIATCSVQGARTLVLGSTQRSISELAHGAAVPPQEALGFVRRQTGGGAVVVAPDAQVWVDAWVPRRDPLWTDDVRTSSHWLGEAWVAALEALGATSLTVHRGGLTRATWSDLVCFAGVGPGEVLSGGEKIVGIAQRRDREGAWFHSCAPLVWDASSMAGALTSAAALAPGEAVRLAADLGRVARGVRAVAGLPWRLLPNRVLIAAVEDAIVAALP